MSAAGESRLCIVIATCTVGQRITALDAEVDALRRRGRSRQVGLAANGDR
jgi:hypothetical protein